MSKYSSNHDGTHTASIDGSGAMASVSEHVAEGLLRFFLDMRRIFKDTTKILDVGAGMGYLQKVFEECTKKHYDVYSVEGYGQLEFVDNPEKRIIADFTKPLSSEYHKDFDLVISFECVEHVPENMQSKFWENIFYCSDLALVGIHVMGHENTAHCCIRSPKWWSTFFEEKNIKIKKIYSTPGVPWTDKAGNVVTPWECSVIYLLEKKQEDE